jgi:hypothetical protein
MAAIPTAGDESLEARAGLRVDLWNTLASVWPS